MVVILLLSGKAESGKDTFFEIASSRDVGYSIRRISFADAVKDIARQIGWDGNKDQRGRKFLQSLSFCARVYDEDIWIRKVFDPILLECNNESNCERHELIIVTDCRYPNQISYIKKRHSVVYTVRIDRSKFQSQLTEDLKNHQSEISLDGYEAWDYQIVNDGSISEFAQKVISTVEAVLRRSEYP